uniref:Uncharacterized protein n=1 Tax=Chromera velia CCMP2878 TaxID=1169474 RepID=A0A0G4I5Z0_9ALVE|eukprot:Cvel_11265.t1-p1 / transcript=Cvel_11265.t1 / gene=Cvel_11265 / organism=Chromera_velia_CCMP2878 / gene_product=hypothetical protein / transcript_product=hypothetical protein / location=Cvel_scaffold702:53457-55584(+) / protein_length=541 / sequence_SO=supercontig / SO=protein_coding / is_pseudo=false
MAGLLQFLLDHRSDLCRQQLVPLCGSDLWVASTCRGFRRLVALEEGSLASPLSSCTSKSRLLWLQDTGLHRTIERPELLCYFCSREPEGADLVSVLETIGVRCQIEEGPPTGSFGVAVLSDVKVQRHLNSFHSFRGAASVGNFALIERLCEGHGKSLNGIPASFQEGLVKAACETNQQALLRLLSERLKGGISNLLDLADAPAPLSLLQFLHRELKIEMKYLRVLVSASAVKGDLSSVAWAVETSPSSREDGEDWSNLCEDAAFGGNAEMVGWLWEHRQDCGFYADPRTLLSAARSGNIECVRTVKTRLEELCMPRWPMLTASRAVRSGNLNLVQWLQEQGCPFAGCESADAKRNNDIGLLEWLRSEGPKVKFSVSAEATTTAADHGHLEAFRWLRALDPPCEVEGQSATDAICSLSVAVSGATHGETVGITSVVARRCDVERRVRLLVWMLEGEDGECAGLFDRTELQEIHALLKDVEVAEVEKKENGDKGVQDVIFPGSSVVTLLKPVERALHSSAHSALYSVISEATCKIDKFFFKLF